MYPNTREITVLKESMRTLQMIVTTSLVLCTCRFSELTHHKDAAEYPAEVHCTQTPVLYPNQSKPRSVPNLASSDHTHTHTPSLSLSLSLSPVLYPNQSKPRLVLNLASSDHTHTHTPSLSLSLSLSPVLYPNQSKPRLVLNLASSDHTHTHTLPLSLSLSLSCPPPQPEQTKVSGEYDVH